MNQCIVKETHFGRLFHLQLQSKIFSTKKSPWSSLNNYPAVTSCKNCISFIKTPFWAHLGPLLAPKRLSILSHYVSVTRPTYINLDNLEKKWLLCVPIQCLQWPSFILNMQCLFWAHLGPLLAAKLKTKSFPKKSFVSILNHYAGVILC